MALLDLTQPFSDGMFSLPTLPPITVQRLRCISEDGVNVTQIGCSVHSGTHIDAPCHFVEGGRDVAEIDLEEVSGDAVALSVRCEPMQEITVRDLERQSVEVQRGDIVLIETGFGRFFTEDPDLYHQHPYLAEDAAEWLVARGAKMVALDIPTPDRPEPARAPNFGFPVHHILLEENVLVGEHLANLERVAGRRCRVFAFPLPILHADGSFVRFVAET